MLTSDCYSNYDKADVLYIEKDLGYKIILHKKEHPDIMAQKSNPGYQGPEQEDHIITACLDHSVTLRLAGQLSETFPQNIR